MPLKLFSQSQIDVPPREARKKSSWRDKFSLSSRSRESSQSRHQREQCLNSPPSKTYFATNGHHELTSSIATSALQTPSTPLLTSKDTASFITKPGKDKANVDSTDLWSAAYFEALQDFGDEVKSVVSKGEKIQTLLISLDQTNQELAGDSLFWRGLRRLQPLLKNFKMALDLASPLTSIEPTASTAVGVVNCVTSIAIAICGAEDSLNSQIINMLEHVAIIDDCDILGQKLDPENGIHKALVPVYKDLLNFYITALNIFSSKVFVLAIVCDQLSQRLPTIVSDFVKHASLLRERVGNATLELVTDIKKLLQDNKIQKLLGFDKDKQRSEVHSELRELRATDACKWLIAHSRFVEWYNAPNSAQLIVFGPLGCGKTVITAHVIEELIHMSNHKIPRPVICYHYCGNDERGKALYIYSSLLLQLLDQQEGLKVEFDRWYEETKKFKHSDPIQSSAELGRFLCSCVENLNRELFIVIDALDECDSSSRDELIILLETLANKTQRLKIFFSSRPQQEVEHSLQKALQIRWTFSQERDTIITDHTVKRHLKGFPLAVQSLVSQELSGLAEGSAIWVRLTVQLIQKRMIKAVGPMKTFLSDVPSPTALSQLYGELFVHATGNDTTNEQVATCALQILAVARRPLSILELGWAVALNSDCGTSRKLVHFQSCVDESRVLSLLQPFLSNIDFEDVKKRQVRLVHQSLKELILQDTPARWTQSRRLDETEQARKQRTLRRQSQLEAELLRACVKYLLFDDFDEYSLFSDEQETIQNLGEMPEFTSFDDLNEDDVEELIPIKTSLNLRDEEEVEEICYDPAERGFGEFYVYASCFWLDHFRMSDPLPDMADTVKLCEAGSRRLENWTAQICRPDCTVMPKFDYDGLFKDPLTIVSLHGPEIALKTLLEDDKVGLGAEEVLDSSVRQAVRLIIQWGDLSRLAVIFQDARVGPWIRHIGTFNQIMTSWARSDKVSRPWTDAFDLVFDIRDDVLIKEEQGNELLCLAVSHGCLPMVERLFEMAAQTSIMRSELLRDVRRNVRPPDYHQSVGEAVWHGHVEILRYLLEQEGIEAHLRHQDSTGNNVLHRAARLCNPEVMSLLLSYFPEGVDQINKEGDTPLHLLVFESQSTATRLESAKILLADGHANVRGGCIDKLSSWNEPLRMAARYGDTAMCRVLVEVGRADPRSVLRFVDGRPELIDPVHSTEQTSSVLETICLLAGIDCKGFTTDV